MIFKIILSQNLINRGYYPFNYFFITTVNSPAKSRCFYFYALNSFRKETFFQVATPEFFQVKKLTNQV